MSDFPDWCKCEWCGCTYDRREGSVTKKGEYTKVYVTSFCGMKCYNEWKADKDAKEAKRKADEARREAEREAEYKAIENAIYAESKRRDSEYNQRKERKDRLLEDAVKIDGVWYSKDKTILVKVEESVQNLVIPDGVTEILPELFGSDYTDRIAQCNNTLKSVKIPSSVKKISYCAFYGCSELSSVNLPNGLTEIGENAFSDCALVSVDIPKSVTKIGKKAFKDCKNLKSVKLHDGLTEIGYMAFSNCALVSVNIPNSVTECQSGPFAYCKSLEHVSFPKKLKAKWGEYKLYNDFCENTPAEKRSTQREQKLRRALPILPIAMSTLFSALLLSYFGGIRGVGSVVFPLIPLAWTLYYFVKNGDYHCCHLLYGTVTFVIGLLPDALFCGLFAFLGHHNFVGIAAILVISVLLMLFISLFGYRDFFADDYFSSFCLYCLSW